MIGWTGCARPSADDERVRVTYWEKWTGEEAAALQTVVDEFNRSQQRVRVDLVSMAQIDRKLIVATAGGNPPDLAGVWLPQIVSLAERSALRPLDDLIQADARAAGRPESEAVAAHLARFEPVYAGMMQARGRVYAQPLTPTATALHWNKSLFRAAGLDPERPPRTRAELDEFARRLTVRDPATGAIVRAGFLPQEPGWWLWANPVWFGASFLDPQGEVAIGHDPGALAALRWLRGYTEEYGADELKRFISGFGTFGSPQAAFFSGKVAMVLQGVWFDDYIRQFAPGLDYGAAAWPALDEAAAEGPPFTVAEADLLVIPRGARHPEAAWEFIRYLNTVRLDAREPGELAGLERLCFRLGRNSPLREWSPAFAERHPHPYIGLFRELAASPRAMTAPLIGVWLEYLRELNTANERVRLLQATPEQALADVQARMAPSWRRHRESVARQTRAAGEDTP